MRKITNQNYNHVTCFYNYLETNYKPLFHLMLLQLFLLHHLNQIHFECPILSLMNPHPLQIHHHHCHPHHLSRQKVIELTYHICNITK